MNSARLLVNGLLLAALVGCAVLLTRWAPAAAAPSWAASALHGVWVPSDAQSTAPGTGAGGWIAITATTPTQARLAWIDNGFCIQVTGSISERELRILDHPTRVTFAFDTSTSATATFTQNDRTWTQRYAKRSATIPACDWLLQ